MVNIRGRRRRPGLQYQHLAAVRAAADVSQAEVNGATKDSQLLEFKPRRVVAGDYRFDIGTAGSTSLVFQTVLPALMLAPSPSTIVLKGGTHNPLAPPFEFVQYAFLPLINRMGAQVEGRLLRRGFAPAGGGCIQASIQPVKRLQWLDLMQRGEIVRCSAEVILANLPTHIAERELAVIARKMPLQPRDLNFTIDTDVIGPGNVVVIIIDSENVTACFSAFGRKGVPAERVAAMAVHASQHYLASGTPVGGYLADQLLVFMAMAGGGRFVTMKPSLHTLTNIAVIEAFMSTRIDQKQISERGWQLTFVP
jgi:RNA 3'-terminal phosphate cyclase (ATP)